LFYVGFDKKIENISHHALFLMDFYQHAKDIYDAPQAKRAFFINFPR
jgi:phytoene desaturase